jgi:hypothetical protein
MGRWMAGAGTMRVPAGCGAVNIRGMSHVTFCHFVVLWSILTSACFRKCGPCPSWGGGRWLQHASASGVGDVRRVTCVVRCAGLYFNPPLSLAARTCVGKSCEQTRRMDTDGGCSSPLLRGQLRSGSLPATATASTTRAIRRLLPVWDANKQASQPHHAHKSMHTGAQHTDAYFPNVVKTAKPQVRPALDALQLQ